MGKKIPLVIGHLQFVSKKEAAAYFRNILQSAELEVELSSSDLADVEALLSCHPAANEKIGTGIAAIFVGQDTFGGRCYHVRRADNTVDNFGMKYCINGEPPAFRRFSNACRLVVATDMADFRNRAFNDPEKCLNGYVRCAKTGFWVSSAGAHVDHAFPLTFSRIVRDFISSRAIDLEKFDAYAHEGLYGCVFSDPAMVEDFRQYHKEVAVLQVVTKESNLRDAWQGRLDRETDSTNIAV